ncbi:MAG: U32 family peptidase, partial [Nitrososphaeraceae archaeon]
NSSCYGNHNFSDEGKKWIKNQVQQMKSIGIESVTVTNYDLARRISDIAPDIKIILSVMFNIIDVDAITYTQKQNFNFSGVVIGKGLTKRIPNLKHFLKFLRSQNLKGIVIANDFCPTSNCPERMSDHNNTCAHYHDNKEDYISPSIHCREMAMADPAHFLQAPIINPNDIDFYESIGVQYFKLTDRVMPDSTLIKACEAYFKRQYSGNLFELFTYTSYLGEQPKSARRLSDEEITDIYLGGYASFKSHRSYFVCQPYADAETLSKSGGFFDFFAQGKCTLQCGSRRMEIPGCFYCEDQAQQLLKYDSEEWHNVHDNISRYIKLSRKSKDEIINFNFNG